MFDFTASPLPVRRDLAEAFGDVWERLAAPGTWWTGAERVALADVARSAYDGAAPTGHPLLVDGAVAAAALLSSRPSAVSQKRIATWERNGVDSYRYIELISVVAQVTAVDTFHRAMELPLEALPEPVQGEPSRAIPDPSPTITKAWVPMVGPPTIPSSLSAVPAEVAALESLHGPAYLTYEEMGNPAIERGLSRAQIELVASRTSAINECFF